jgi:hypothetical protein
VLYGTDSNPIGTANERHYPDLRGNDLSEENGQSFSATSDATLQNDGDPYRDFRFPDPPHNPSEFAGQANSAGKSAGSSWCCLVVFILTLTTKWFQPFWVIISCVKMMVCNRASISGDYTAIFPPSGNINSFPGS